jgi:hypothetical protein
MKLKLALLAILGLALTLGLTACQTHSDHSGHGDGGDYSEHSGHSGGCH